MTDENLSLTEKSNTADLLHLRCLVYISQLYYEQSVLPSLPQCSSCHAFLTYACRRSELFAQAVLSHQAPRCIFAHLSISRPVFCTCKKDASGFTHSDQWWYHVLKLFSILLKVTATAKLLLSPEKTAGAAWDVAET